MRSRVLRFRASVEDLSPEQVALLLSVGIVLGVFPIVGCPTGLCLVAAFGLRMNFAALQLLNNICSPLQLALLLPLARVGAWLCGGAGAGGESTASKLWAAAFHAVAGWASICVPGGILLYFVLLFAIRRRHLSWVPRFRIARSASLSVEADPA